MNIISWNCRGVAGKGFVNLLKDMIQDRNTNFICLMEKHVSENKAKKIIKRTGFSYSFVVDADGQAWGIWCLCNNDVWMVKVLRSSNQYVHMEVSWLLGI
jgi:exonuclease III